MVEELIRGEIDCHDFIEKVKGLGDDKYLEILLELCQHKQDEECIICFRDLYTTSLSRWRFDPSQLKTADLDEMKANFNQLTRAEKKHPALISNYYYQGKFSGNHLFTFEELKQASEAGDKLAPLIIGRELNSLESIPYYKLAVRRGMTYAAFELMKIYDGKNKKIKQEKDMDKIYKYYIQGKKISENFEMDPNIYLDAPELFVKLLNYINYKLNQQLTEKDEIIKQKEVMITELLYEPGGRMYYEVKRDFENKISINT